MFVLSSALLTLTDLSVAREARIQSEIIRIYSPVSGLKLALHHEFPAGGPALRRSRNIVLFAEGSAVPTSGNAGFKINGSSWMDDLAGGGFDVWSLDYLGYGESDRYPDSDTGVPPGRASECASQLEWAARFILKKQRAEKLSVIGDSFGSLVAGIYATRAPQLLDKLILFAPLTPVAAPKATTGSRPTSKYRFVTADDLWQLYLSWLPAGASAGLDRNFFLNRWGAKYLSSDPTSRQRTPPSVMVPAGPDLDSLDIDAGHFPYDPRRIKATTLIIFGEWDSVATEDGGQRLFALLTGTEHKRRIVIGNGTHILQLESVRSILYREVQAFLEFS
ncbi:MAG TPA: alpha/beta fold hydrolase [Pyrinomonadaceae bacterium]